MTVERIARLHNLSSNKREVLGKLAKAAEESGNFGVFLQNSMRVLSPHVEAPRLGYLLRLMQEPSGAYDLRQPNAAGKRFSSEKIKLLRHPSTPGLVANTIVEGTMAGKRPADQKTLALMFRFYRDVHMPGSQTKRVIASLKG
jgi:hypothetical protein